MIDQKSLMIQTKGRGFYDITHGVQQFVQQSDCNKGLCHVFIQHTSASLLICENADLSVRQDVEYFSPKLVKDGDPNFTHNYEGDDDMAGHIRNILTQTSIQLPVSNHRLNLGNWQGLYLY